MLLEFVLCKFSIIISLTSVGLFLLHDLLLRMKLQLDSFCRPVFAKLFRFRIQIRLKFQNEQFLEYLPLSVQENLICVYIDMVNVG